MRTLVEHIELPSKQIARGRTSEGQVGRRDGLVFECHSISDLVERVLMVVTRAALGLTLLDPVDCCGLAV